MFLMGIAGGSGSGKTTFAKKIVSRIAGNPAWAGQIGLLHLDSYYVGMAEQPTQADGRPNFDHPASFDWKLLRRHLHALRLGKQVATPIYDFTTSSRLAETALLGPCQAVIFEGIYALGDPEIRKLLDLKIYLHVEADIRFIRRLHRDVRERGRGMDNIIRQYYDTVRPMHHEYLEPTQKYADLIVGEETDIAADVLAARMKQVIHPEENFF